MFRSCLLDRDSLDLYKLLFTPFFMGYTHLSTSLLTRLNSCIKFIGLPYSFDYICCLSYLLKLSVESFHCFLFCYKGSLMRDVFSNIDRYHLRSSFTCSSYSPTLVYNSVDSYKKLPS